MKEWCPTCQRMRDMNIMYASYEAKDDSQLLGLQCRYCHKQHELWQLVPPPEVGYRWVAGFRVSMETQRRVTRSMERVVRVLAPELLGPGAGRVVDNFTRVEYRPRT